MRDFCILIFTEIRLYYGFYVVFNVRNLSKVLKNDLTPSFVVELVLKDLELARQLCQYSGIANFTLNTGIQFYRMAQQHGYGKSDSSSVIRMIRDLEPLSAEMSANDS